MRRRLAFACAAIALTMAVSGTTALAANGGFKTARPSMLTSAMDDVEITPLLTVGDVFGDSGFRFEAIPDGISLRTRGNGRVDVYVNHETSKVPFPFNTATPTASNGESDFDNSQVSALILNKNSAGVLDGSFVIPSSGGFQRFCSNYLATGREGFNRDILFTNEESPDYVFRQEDAWPPPIGDPDEEENGVVLALDVKSRQYHVIYGMGRHNHENNVAIPGFEDLVVLSGDDTFTSGPLTIPPGGPNLETSAASQSQLYSYIASDTDSLLTDEGDLLAFVSDDPAFDDYYDFVPGSATSVSGHFIEVPKDIATGKDTDGSELKAADLGYPLPPADGSWQRDLRSVAPLGIDGPQWVLEYWSQLNNVFDFVRVEDIAYDKRPGMGNVVYVVDSGRGTAGVSEAGRSTNGRVWKMVLDPEDPTHVTSLSIAVEGDDNPVKTLGEVHQPDNIETTQTGLLLTEDPGSTQQFIAADQGLPNATTARLWYVPFSGTPQVVVKIDQSADGGPTDVDGRPAGNWGAWETSGIVDASAAFGPGAFLINVQAHTLWVEKAPGPDTFIDANSDPDFTYKREGGQLLLLRIPGI
ncbi:MAG TPA: hypothetical protein VKB32_09620 [Actinomycetota bacterium]|nr:hypothetical protein [Actinomycetota bacterium]